MSGRPRRTANEMAGQLRTPRWFVFVLALGGLTFALYIKYGATESTERMMDVLVGDPELQLPVGYSDKERGHDLGYDETPTKPAPTNDDRDPIQQIEHE